MVREMTYAVSEMVACDWAAVFGAHGGLVPGDAGGETEGFFDLGGFSHVFVAR